MRPLSPAQSGSSHAMTLLHRLRGALIFLLALLPALPAGAVEPPLPRAAPAAAGMSQERLARITTVLRADVDAGRLPGAVIAIARRGRLVWYDAVGFQDAQNRIPMQRDTIFPIASMTKPLTGVAILMLLEEGKLALTDPVERFLPELGNRQVAVLTDAVRAGAGPIATEPAQRSITIQDLMRHTSGITYGGRGGTAVHKLYPATSSTGALRQSPAEFLAQLQAAPLLYQPGTVWDYGLSTDVLGLVVEKISGQSLGAFLQQRLFRPLGMGDSGFVVPEAKRNRLAQPLAQDPLTGERQRIPIGTAPLRFECGGGCATATAGDYLRFAQMLLDGGRLGNARILGRPTVQAMVSDHMRVDIRNTFTDFDRTLVGYGFGLTVAVRQPGGAGLLGNAGLFTWGGAYGTNFWVDPQEQLVVVFMAATPGATRQYYRRVINAMVYQAIEN